MSEVQDSIFTKIVQGEIPCHKVYEDEHTLAFLDINPVQPGHTLVIPKKQVEFVWDMDEETYGAVMKTAHHVAKRLQKVMGRKYVGEAVVGIDVPHAHVHLIPFDEPEQLKKVLTPEVNPVTQEELAEIATKLRMEEN